MTSDTVKALADRYFLKTADQIETPKPKPEDDHAVTRLVWPRWKTALFDELKPHAIAVVSTKDNGMWPLRGARFGHNRSYRPIKLAYSGSLKDTITPRYNNNPFLVEVGVQIRLWTDSSINAKKFEFILPKRLPKIADELVPKDDHGKEIEDTKGWKYFHELDLSLLELEMSDMANNMNIPLWDDEGLSQYLDQVSEQRLRNSGRGL